MTPNQKRNVRVKKTWVEALFALGAMPPQVAKGDASHEDVAEQVGRVEKAERRLAVKAPPERKDT